MGYFLIVRKILRARTTIGKSNFYNFWKFSSVCFLPRQSFYPQFYEYGVTGTWHIFMKIPSTVNCTVPNWHFCKVYSNTVSRLSSRCSTKCKYGRTLQYITGLLLSVHHSGVDLILCIVVHGTAAVCHVATAVYILLL